MIECVGKKGTGEGMALEGSITDWYRELEAGNQAAATELWSHFFDRIVHLAHRKMGNAPRQVRDQEDVALSAFKSLCKGIQRGRFPDLANRDEIWRLLIVITTRKAQDHLAYQFRQRRLPATSKCDSVDADLLLNQALSRDPTPEFAVQMVDTVQNLLDKLDHEDLRQIAILKMEGYTNPEIAERMGRGIATIERKLRTIRSLWENEA